MIFMGTPEFALPSLKALYEARQEIILVITQPDRPKGRGLRVSPSPVKELALSLNLPLLQPERLRDSSFLDKIQELRPQIIVVVAYGQILPREVLSLPEYGCVNLHPSLLPKYRGPAPIAWAILQGEDKTGVTTMLLGEGLDDGPILLQREVAIGPDDTAAVLHDRLAHTGAELLLETISGLEKGTIHPLPQPEELASYAPKLTKEAGQIDWSRPAQSIHNQVRATNPWPGAYTYYQGDVLKVWQTRLTLGLAEPVTEARPGEILGIQEEGLLVQTGDRPLLIIEVQRPGGKRMSLLEYVKGHPLPKGSFLGS